MRRASIALFIGLGLLRSARADDAAQLNDFLRYTREVVAKQHLIVYAKIDFDDPKKKDLEFRYDHYPEVERMQLLDGSTYARKQGADWLKSDDWAETGTPAPKEFSDDFENWIGLANAPLQNIHEERDKSQGGVVVARLPNEDRESKDITFEMRRERSTGVLYPRFSFVPFGGKALIHGYSGPMHYGPDHVMAHFRYDFMFKVNVQEATPAPGAEAAPSATVNPAAAPNAKKNPPGGEELLKAASRKMQTGTWKVDATLSGAEKVHVNGSIHGADFDLAIESGDGSDPIRHVAIATLAWLSKDRGKTWEKTESKDRGVYNWVQSPIRANPDTPAFDVVGAEQHEGETWQHLRLKTDQIVKDESRRPHYWVAVNAKGEAVAVRRFEGPVIIQGTVVNAKAEYTPSKEPFIKPPMLK